MITLAKLASLPPCKQQPWLRRYWIQPFLGKLLKAGVKRWTLINAMAAEVRDLELAEDEARNDEPPLSSKFDAARRELAWRAEQRKKGRKL